MKNTEFVEAVKKIAYKNPSYREGGTGKDGTCDCIGLIMGAIGKEYPMHSTNYFARFQMRVLDGLLDESQLHEGAVVYKSRRSVDQLHERYQPGGRYHNGDLLDYYHVGVVTGLDPLEITHCTSTGSINGIARDNSIRAWSHIGDLLDVELNTYSEEKGGLMVVSIYDAKVVTTGGHLNFRSSPRVGGTDIGDIPNGALLQVFEETNEEWAKVYWNHKNGYVMRKFLSKIGDPTTDSSSNADDNNDNVTLVLPRSTAERLLSALNAAL